MLRHTWCEIHILDSEVGAWEVGPNISAKEVLDLYQREIERAKAIFAATPLHAAPGWWRSDLFGDFRLDYVRQVVLHVMTETATHAGHLDAVLELIDGKL